MRKWISLLLACFMLFGFAGQLWAKSYHAKGKGDENNRVRIVLQFNDIREAKWAQRFIAKMQAKKILYGYKDGTFRPNQPVTRVEAVAMAVRLMGLEKEAMEKPKNIPLHFKDAKLLDKQYAWAKGYVVVALENGLFDASEDLIQPNKPASRVWVASLLVRALGLEDEALKKMTEIPQFKDAKSIPAGAVGYVNVAVEKGLVSGYPDGTFKPNKPVTRAEMAVLLDLAEKGLLDKEGAVRVSGVVKDIRFPDKNVSDDVYGQITVQTFLGDTFTYEISPELAIQYGDSFIPAKELDVNDKVFLVVLDNRVVDGVLLDKREIPDSLKNVLGYTASVIFKDGDKIELAYDNDGSDVSAKVVRNTDQKEEKIEGSAAVTYMEKLLGKMNLSPKMGQTEIIDKLIGALNLEKEDLEKVVITIDFANGVTAVIQKQFKDDEEHGNQDDEQNGDKAQIREFELKAVSENNGKFEVKYEWEDGKAEGEIKRESGDSKGTVKGDRAVETIEKWLDEAELSENIGKDEAVDRILSVLQLDKESLKSFEMEVQFSNGKKLNVDWDHDDDDDNRKSGNKHGHKR